MSLEGNATAAELRGKINSVDVLCVDAYAIAVKNGFEGTEQEWLDSLKGEKGDTPVKGKDYYTEAEKKELENKITENVLANINTSAAVISYVDLVSSKWQGTASPYSQVVTIDGATEYSKIDLNPSVEQLAKFYEKDIAFVVENDDGVITVYSIGQKPLDDYNMQVTITEVVANG